MIRMFCDNVASHSDTTVTRTDEAETCKQRRRRLSCRLWKNRPEKTLIQRRKKCQHEGRLWFYFKASESIIYRLFHVFWFKLLNLLNLFRFSCLMWGEMLDLSEKSEIHFNNETIFFLFRKQITVICYLNQKIIKCFTVYLCFLKILYYHNSQTTTIIMF